MNDSPKKVVEDDDRTFTEPDIEAFLASFDKSTVEAILAQINGQTPEEAAAAITFRDAIWSEADKYFELPPAQWPPLHFNWDLRKESQRFALDGCSEDYFDRLYPQGFVLGWTDLAAFDPKLCHFSRRDGDQELWELGSGRSLSFVIAYVVLGHPMTPPFICADKRMVRIQGGHHRYAAMKASAQGIFPVYAQASDVENLDRILQIRWLAENAGG